MPAAMLSLRNVVFSYDNKFQVLRNVSFDVKENDYICIVGHNGSGKSTISKVISGLVKPQSGEIFIEGELLSSRTINRLRKKIGVIFQNPDNQFIGITTEDDIAFGLENYKVEQAKMSMIINNIANVINITDLIKREAFDLSGGQKQKVAISSVLALTPKIIVFDESTSMLDPKSKLQIKMLMKELQTRYNRTIISITHDMEELSLATKVLCMNKGEIAFYNTHKEFVKDYHFLTQNSLELPNNLRLTNLLQLKNYKLTPTMDLDNLVNQIWKQCNR